MRYLSQIRFVVDRYHVSAPLCVVGRDILRRIRRNHAIRKLKRGDIPARKELRHLAALSVIAARALHREKRQLYTVGMSGGSWSRDQKRARGTWERAEAWRLAIADTLKLTDPDTAREDLHARLDWALDQVDAMRARALERFPDVRESFTISEGSL